MVILIISVSIIVSLTPSIILYKWIQKKIKDEKSKEICKKAFVRGVIAVFLIILTSGILAIIGRIMGLQEINPLTYRVYYTFIVLAFAEELVKFLTFKRVLKNNQYDYSWFSLTIIMIMVGLGFGCIENITYSLTSGIVAMLIKGISLGHAGYGFIMGWFYGKMKKAKKKIYGVLAFLIPWILHGLYDFGLSSELLEINDGFAIISVSLTIISLICIVLTIRFVKRRCNDKEYTSALIVE